MNYKNSSSETLNEMNEYLQDSKYLCVLVLLRSKEIIKYIDNFMKMKSDYVSDDILDNIKDIIVAAKTLYESDIYCDPYDDIYYDKLISKYKKFRQEPFGYSLKGMANTSYKYENLSGTLDKVHFIFNEDRTANDDRGTLEDWFYDMPIRNNELIYAFVNQKKDGVSATIDFKYDGESGYYGESAVSRGKVDHGEGTDISMIIPDYTFSGKEIKKLLGYYPKYIGIQFELLISNKKKSEFEKYIGQKFANNRSAASALLRRLIFSTNIERNILKKFISLVPVGYDILDEYKTKSFNDIPWDELYIVLCKSFLYGDIEMEYESICGTKKELLNKFRSLANEQIDKRDSLNHSIDGLVLTIVNKDIQKLLGRTNSINKYQIAYKFPEQGEKTIVRDMLITTGNFGYKEILLIVDPVILNGTTQSKAQVHSLNKFNKMKLRIGDEIILKLSGDVIPYGYKDSTCESGDGKKLKLPKYCDCGSKLIEEKNKLRCSNKKCPYRTIGSLVNFFTALNAKGIGEKTCEQLYNELHVKNPSDILKLTIDDFKSLKGFKTASAQICMNTINDIINKPKTVSAILSSLGIDSFRSSTAVKLLDIISINELIKLLKEKDIDKLISIIKSADGIDKNAAMIAEGLIDRADELIRLLSILTIKNDVKYDKTILVSGIRNNEMLEKIANDNGFNVKDTGKVFDILVIKDNSYRSKSKAVYAKSKNLPIMTIDDFINKYKKD